MKYTFALAGNPNCGKTTVFNALTGSAQYVGNWPGVTVEKKSGRVKGFDDEIEIIDLPGIYSLSPYSVEEVVATDYIIKSKPDVVINVIDASNLERNLFLTLQLLDMEVKVIVAMNMYDIVQKRGDKLDIKGLENELGIKIIPIIARKGKGIKDLVSKSIEISKIDDNKKEYNLKENSTSNKEDEENNVKEKYEYIKTILSKYVIYKEKEDNSITDKIDKVLTNRIVSIPIFLLIMMSIYYISISVLGTYATGLMEKLIELIRVGTENVLINTGANKYIMSLILDGIIGGVGSVIVFVPQIMILFFFIALLEDSGYMARISFVLDKIFRGFGLSGKSFIPMFVGSGCSVPGIMAARTLENDRDRKLTIILTPFISCGAKLPIYLMFAGAFFPDKSHIIIISMYAIGVAVAIISGIILKRTLFKGSPEIFLLELPQYKFPTIKNIMLQVWDKGKSFLKKAGTIIFAGSVIIWFMQTFDFTLHLANSPKESILGVIGIFIAPIFKPLGFGDWKASISILTGVIAKEMVVASLGVLNGLGDGANSLEIISALKQSFTPLTSVSFMIFVLLASPCVAAIGAMKKELNSWKFTLFALGYQTILAYIVAMLVYQIGSLL